MQIAFSHRETNSFYSQSTILVIKKCFAFQMKYTLGCIDNPGYQLCMSIYKKKVTILQAILSFECKGWHLFFSVIVFANKSGKHFHNETISNIWGLYCGMYMKFQFLEGCSGEALGGRDRLEWHSLGFTYSKGCFFWVCSGLFGRCMRGLS